MSFTGYAAVISLTAGFVASTALRDEATERKGLSGAEIEDYVEQLVKDQQIITSLKVRLVKGNTIFDVTSGKNTDELPWLIQVNVSDEDFRNSSEKYVAENFKMPIHEIVTVKRKKLHSAVWVQDTEAAQALTLPAGALPESGETGRELQPLNELMRQTLRDNNIPGATLAVTRDGQLIFKRGFGYSDIEQSQAMSPDANMRIASLSKPITAVAILILMEQGKLELDKPALDYLAADPSHHFETQPAVNIDARWAQVTVRHLLQHSGGWDRDKSKDPMFRIVEMTRTLKLDHLARIPDIVRYQLGQPLDFDPGARYAYSNFGYCLLGRIIEAVTGVSYEAFVAEQILAPAQMTHTRLGRTRLSDRADDEVRYYTQKLQKFPAVWDLSGRKDGQFATVAAPYGQWDIEVMDSHGGWTSTAADLVRFVDAVNSPTSPLLKPETRQIMLQPPSFAGPTADNYWYGLGWNARAAGAENQISYWHIGSFSGTSSLMVHRWDGFSWAVLFNVDRTGSDKRCAEVVDSAMHRAVDLAVQ